jgi:hypothetical protein
MIFIDNLFYSIYKNTTKFSRIYQAYYSVGLLIVLFYINFLTIFIFFKNFNEIYDYHIDKVFVILIGLYFIRYFLINDRYINIIEKCEKRNFKNKYITLIFKAYPAISFIIYLISLGADFYIIFGLISFYFILMYIMSLFK